MTTHLRQLQAKFDIDPTDPAQLIVRGVKYGFL